MKLKPEIIRILKRENGSSALAIARLQDKCRSFEQQYGWVTNEFLVKFDTGEIGDDLDFFRWYAYAEAMKDWQITQSSLKELLIGSEAVHVA